MKQKNHSKNSYKSQALDFLQKHKVVVLYIMFLIFLGGILMNSYRLFFAPTPKSLFENKILSDSITKDIFQKDFGSSDYLKAYSIYEQLKDTASMTPEQIKKLEKELDKLLLNEN